MSLYRSTIIFAIFTIFAQVLGVVRDVVLVRFAGVGSALDAYYMAFKVPDLLNGFYAVFLGSVVFIPIITRAYKNGDLEEVSRKVNEVLSFVFVVILGLSTAIFIFLPEIVNFLVPSWDFAKQAEVVKLSRILVFSQLFFPLGIVAGSMGMVFGKIKSVASSSMVYNLGILLGTIILYPHLGVTGAVLGVLFGSILFALVQMWPRDVMQVFSKIGFVYDKVVWKNFITSNSPRLISVFAWQFFLVLLASLAAFYGNAKLSTYTIAYNMNTSVLSIVGVSLASVLMPLFSKHHESGNSEDLRNSFESSVINIVWIGIFFSYLLYFMSYEVVHGLFIFSRIPFETEILIAGIFSIFVLCLPMQNYFEVLRKYLYATNKIWEVSMQILYFIFVFIAAQFLLAKFIFISSPILSIPTGFFLANLFGVIFIFNIRYKIYNLFSIKSVFQNLYKPMLSAVLSSVVYLTVFSKYFPIQNFSNSFDFIVFAVYKFLVIFAILITFMVLLRDKIFLDILKYLRNKF